MSDYIAYITNCIAYEEWAIGSMKNCFNFNNDMLNVLENCDSFKSLHDSQHFKNALSSIIHILSSKPHNLSRESCDQIMRFVSDSGLLTITLNYIINDDPSICRWCLNLIDKFLFFNIRWMDQEIETKAIPCLLKSLKKCTYLDLYVFILNLFQKLICRNPAIVAKLGKTRFYVYVYQHVQNIHQLNFLLFDNISVLMVTIARNARLTEDRQVIHFCVYTIIPELFKSHTFEIDELAIKILIEFTKTCKGIVSFTDEYFKSIYLNLNPALRNQKGYCALYLDELCIAIVGMNIYNYHKYKLTEEESTSSKVIPL